MIKGERKIRGKRMSNKGFVATVKPGPPDGPKFGPDGPFGLRQYGSTNQSGT